MLWGLLLWWAKNPLRRSEFGFEPFKGQAEGDVLDVFVWMWGQKEWKEREGGEVKGQTPLAEKCFCEQKNYSVVKENIVVGWVGVGVPKRPDPLKPKSGTESGMFQGEGKAASRLCTSRRSCAMLLRWMGMLKDWCSPGIIDLGQTASLVEVVPTGIAGSLKASNTGQRDFAK